MTYVGLQSIKKGMIQETSTRFSIHDDGLLRFKNIMCVPNDCDLRRKILKEAHNTKFAMHSENIKMYMSLQKNHQWHGMRRDIAEFVSKCLMYQQVKTKHQKPGGLLQPLPILKWKQEHISMDFMIGLPKTRRNQDSMQVIVDCLAKSSHFLTIKIFDSVDQLAKLYVREVIKSHGIPVSIILDRDPRFASRF